MKYKTYIEAIRGTFIEELPNRFRCIGIINGQSHICYVPSSSKLSHCGDFGGQAALFTKVSKGTSPYRYQLLAIKCGRQYMCVNTVFANTVVKESINKRLFSFAGSRRIVYSEKNISGYKADLFIHDTNTLVEIKSVIDLAQCSIQPSLVSERALSQLDKLADLMEQGYNVVYLFVALCPWIEKIQIDSNSKFASKFKRCVEMGMQVRGISLKTSQASCEIKGLIQVEISEGKQDGNIYENNRD